MKMTSYSPQRSLYERLSGFSRQSLAASQVARIVGNCFRNPAQMRSRSLPPASGLCECANTVRVTPRARKHRSGRPRRSSCVNHSAQLRQLPGRSQVTTLSAFAVSHALVHSRFAQISSVLSSDAASGSSFFLQPLARGADHRRRETICCPWIGGWSFICP